jgi:PST family polysaccharide transporter
VAAIAAVFPAFAIFHDHRVIVVSLAAEVAVYAAISHLLARSPYRFGWEKTELRQALTFSMPLTLNGLCWAFIQQFDRFAVGAWFGVTELALYTVTVSLGVVPGSLLLVIFGNIGMSYLISGGEEADRINERYRILWDLYEILALAYFLFTLLFLDILVPLVYGAAYAVTPVMQASAALVGYSRLLRGGAPTAYLLAESRTRELALLNLSSIGGVLAMLVCVTAFQSVGSLFAGIEAGEIVSRWLFLKVLRRNTAGEHELKALMSALAAPLAIIVIFALRSGPAALSRATVLVGGVAAIGLYLGYRYNRSQGLALLRSAFTGSSALPGTTVEGRRSVAER